MQFIYKSHIWLAFSAYIFTSGFAHHLENEEANAIGVLLALGTLMVYTVQQPKLRVLQNQKKVYLAVTLMLGGLCCVIALLFLVNGAELLFYFALLYFICFWYNHPFPIINKSLRELPFLKIWMITVVWTASTSLVPFIGRPEGINWMFFLAHGCLFFAVAILFDERDRLVDEPGLKTIPQLLGSKWSRLLAFLSYLLFICILDFYSSGFHTYLVFYALLPYFVLVLWLIRKNKSDIYYYFFLDSILIFIGLLYWLL